MFEQEIQILKALANGINYFTEENVGMIAY